jgi:AcrR family transcriptional regulator
MDAAGVEFAVNGLAGTRLEAIAARVGISHPRVVQMFGSKRSLFLAVVHAAFDRIDVTFAGAEPTLPALGDAYRRLRRREHTVGRVMLQAYAAAADETVRLEVRRRQLDLQASVARLTGADGLQVRTFFAAGLVLTVSELLELPERRADAAWSAWILELAAPPDGHWDGRTPRLTGRAGGPGAEKSRSPGVGRQANALRAGRDMGCVTAFPADQWPASMESTGGCRHNELLRYRKTATGSNPSHQSPARLLT